MNLEKHFYPGCMQNSRRSGAVSIRHGSFDCVRLRLTPLRTTGLDGSDESFCVQLIRNAPRATDTGPELAAECRKLVTYYLFFTLFAGGDTALRTGTIAPFAGSAAAFARVRTSFWMYCTKSWICRCISSIRSRI